MPADTPPTPTVIQGEGVWIDPEALAQLAAVAALEGCVAAAGMPDLHPGRGLPIGAVVATHDVVYPRLVGGDAGCGARVVVTDLARPTLDKLARRVRSAFEDAPFAEADPAALFAAVWADGARGLASVEGVPESLRALAAAEPVSPHAGLAPWASGGAGYVESLGTIGGGNHFAEVSRVETVADAGAAEAAGLVRGAVVVLVHTGSRGLGAALAARWGAEALRGDAVAAYMADLAGACHFAQANRLVLTWRLRSALGALRSTTVRGGFDVVHNDVRAEGGAWVHRKGAAPAYAEGLTVVLGSRGAPSWVVQGTGSATGLRSVAHGAGRRMGRAEALRRGKARYQRSEMTRSATGARLLCDEADLLYEEHPDAYKAIEPVMAALEAHGLARRVASLEPLVTVKL